jgi:HlyD family secretion protein
VASVDADEGDNVTSLTTIVTVIDPNSKELKLEVDEIDMPGVKLGQRTIVEVEALPDVRFEGEVTYIYPLSIETFGVVVYEVTIDIEVLEGYEFMDGMSASADIIIDERKDVLLVPSRAVGQDSQGNPMVRVVVDERIEDRPVVTGTNVGGETEILEGLREGEMVVVKG